MKYRNVLTGIEIDFQCEISGKYWEPVEAPGNPDPDREEPEKKAVKKNVGRNKK